MLLTLKIEISVDTNYLDIFKMLSNWISFRKNGFKYFIGYRDDIIHL